MGQLLQLLATRPWPAGIIRDRIFTWEGDITPRGQSVPLRLAGALHALKLQGQDALTVAYPPHTVDDDLLWDAIDAVLQSDAAAINAWLDRAPQTNEVRRSVVLIALGHWLAARFDLPMRTSELGASAGLNLNWHRYALKVGGQTIGPENAALTLTPDWTGPLPPLVMPQVTAQAGVDLNPLDLNKDALRVQAYLWPDQPHRIELTQAAIAAADTPVVQSDAIDWLAGQLTHKKGQLHLIYSTVAWQYFPADKQAEGTAMIEAAGAIATDDSPLAWFGMENDGGTPGAAMTLRLWPGDLQIDQGRVDFHGRWVNWTGG